MKKNNKKGFTIVELVIVIAVIAILAAVLIPTFANLIEKANLSNDQQMVANMNKTMAIEFPGSKPEHAGDAIQKLYSAGYSKEKLVTYSKGYKYVYDLSDNKFYLADTNGNLVYPEKKTNKANVWGLYNNGGTNDKVNGVTNYVFLSSPSNHYNYAAAFSYGTYVLDLNNGVLSYSTKYREGDHTFENNDANITLKNGTVLGGSYTVTEENGVKNSISAAYDLNVYDAGLVAEDGTLTFKNYSFVGTSGKTLEDSVAYAKLLTKINDGFDGYLNNHNQDGTENGNTSEPVIPVVKLVFENCVFNEYKSFTPFGAETKADRNHGQASTITEVIFTNCKFVNTTAHAISCNTKENKTALKVTDCEFINCAAGISIRDPKEGSVISNNTFNITGTAADMGQVVQFYKPAEPQTANEYLVLISDNKIETAGSFVRVYSNPSIASANWAKYVKFENNTCPDGLTKVALSDGATEEHKTELEKLVA